MPALCPDSAELAALNLGVLDEPTASQVATHLETCTSCQSTIASLDEGGDEVVRTLRSVSPKNPYGKEASLHRTLETISWLDFGASEPTREGRPPPPPPPALGPAADLSVDELCERLVALGVLDPAESGGGRRVNSVADAGHDVAAWLCRATDEGLLTPFQKTLIEQGRVEELILGDYTILDRLGGGGMGEVYKALHRRMKVRRAIKVIKPELVDSPETVQRFQREVLAAAKLSHHNVVVAHDAGEDKGRHYLVLEFVQGEDLAALVKRQGPLPLDRVIVHRSATRDSSISKGSPSCATCRSTARASATRG